MAARRKPGLDAEGVADLQARLNEGKKPRVALTGPQFPDGSATGTVVRIGDESTEGADYITVRVIVNGVADELAFAPNELELPRRGSKKPPAPVRPAKARATAPRPRAARPQSAAPTRSAAPTQPPAPTPTPTPSATARPAQPAAPVRTSPAKSARPARADEPAVPASTARRSAGGRRKAAAPPVITLTVKSTGASWSVSAQRGAKSVVKSVPVAPGVVTAVADLLAVAGISAAVAEVNETALAEAEARAARLRAELAELDVVLAAHRSPR